MNRSQVFVILVIGAVLGVAGTMLLPDAARRVLPASLTGSGPGVRGKILEKERASDRLLLTVETREGVVLVTVKKRIPEIDLLVQRGDLVTFDLGAYEPFADDPRIRRVQKPEQYEATPMTPPGAAPDTAAASASRAPARDSVP